MKSSIARFKSLLIGCLVALALSTAGCGYHYPYYHGGHAGYYHGHGYSLGPHYGRPGYGYRGGRRYSHGFGSHYRGSHFGLGHGFKGHSRIHGW